MKTAKTLIYAGGTSTLILCIYLSIQIFTQSLNWAITGGSAIAAAVSIIFAITNAGAPPRQVAPAVGIVVIIGLIGSIVVLNTPISLWMFAAFVSSAVFAAWIIATQGNLFLSAVLAIIAGGFAAYYAESLQPLSLHLKYLAHLTFSAWVWGGAWTLLILAIRERHKDS